MPGQPLRLGPFIGGLNTVSDPTAIADAELVECLNFELDIDGSLISRPPMQELAGHASWTQRIITLCEAIFSGTHYLIGSNVDGVYYYTGGSWTLITATFQASVGVQYANTVYLVPKPGSANPGGKWDPVGGFTAIAAIPQGQAAVIHKERLYITPGISATTNASRLKFSDSGDFETWGASDFIDISQGDGTNLVDLTVFQDNLLLFKEHSSYILAYDVRPTDAVVREISSTIGVVRQFCVVNYENQVYIIDHLGWVYEIINHDFHRINTKVPFIRDDTAPSSFADEKIFLSLLEDRLICRFYKKVYVYGLRTRTWSEWESASNILQYFGPIVTLRPSTGNEFYSGSALGANEGVIKFFNTQTSTNKEQTIGPVVHTITCNAKTKNFDMAISHQFKRLWWWGADVSTNNSIKGIATPIVHSFSVTWDAASAHDWDDLETWNQPLSEPTTVETTVSTGTGTSRQFAKFLQGLRYRQINFKVVLTTDGTTVDGPARLFSMTILTESKQVVPKGVN